MRHLAAFLLASLVAGSGSAEAQIITTFAGSGTATFCGDGGPAAAACLNFPGGVATGPGGAVFIADYNNARIRRVDAAGIITTFAGYNEGFCGDGGPATSACISKPWGVAADAAGNVFIADFSNHRIRKVNTAGIINTVAGNGTPGFCGDGGPATSACLQNPTGVAVDAAGNLLIADYWNHRIRKVDPAGTITTLAGNGTVGFCGDGGPAASACLWNPWGVAVDAAGNLFIGDRYNHRVRRVTASGTITTVAGSALAGHCGDGGPATEACLLEPTGVAVEATGALFIADHSNHRVRKVDAAGTITTVTGTGTASFCGDGGPAPAGCLSHPNGVAVNAAGSLFISDHLNHRIRLVPKGLTSLRLAKSTVAGCLKATGKITLASPAPAGGTIVTLASSTPRAAVPHSVTIKAGLTTKSFAVTTTPVAIPETATITATSLGTTLAATLAIRPMAPKSVALTPLTVPGGTAALATVTLECTAAPTGIVVDVFSSKPGVARPAATSVTVPLGDQTATVEVTTSPVAVTTKAAIKARANGVTKAKTLTVTP
jgi:sugar lactone lactonase YvrE